MNIREQAIAIAESELTDPVNHPRLAAELVELRQIKHHAQMLLKRSKQAAQQVSKLQNPPPAIEVSESGGGGISETTLLKAMAMATGARVQSVTI